MLKHPLPGAAGTRRRVLEAMRLTLAAGRRGPVARRRARGAVVCVALGCACAAVAAGMRDHTRPAGFQRGATTVNAAQARALTLTTARAALRELQVWVRTAARLGAGGRRLVARVCPPRSAWLRPGQRVRSFPPDSKSSIYQARVTRILPDGPCRRVEAVLARRPFEARSDYVVEIITARGHRLSVPNEAIIEEGDRRVVYVSHGGGRYAPREIETGLRGELYTEVIRGLTAGESVVTYGSFFIDAEHKLHAGSGGAPEHARHHH